MTNDEVQMTKFVLRHSYFVINMTTEKLTVTLIQSALHWEDIDANLAMFEEKIWQIGQKTDLIVLPEMFTTGFTMNTARLAEPMNSKSFKWMKQQAAQTKAVIVGSIIIKEGQRCFNRLVWMNPDGSYSTYDKRHLFRMADEHNYFEAGKEKIICEIKGWRICPLICYDLRFPVWSRNNLLVRPLRDRLRVGKWSDEYLKVTSKSTKMQNQNPTYDCLIYIANWPEPRQTAWDLLLRARAVENLCYVIGVNRVKQDGNGINYAGGSAVIDHKGERLFYKLKSEIAKTITLDKKELISYREKFPAHLDGDEFEIKG